MTPNKLLFIFQIGSYSLVGEMIPKDVPLSQTFNFQHGTGYVSFSIGRVLLLGNR